MKTQPVTFAAMTDLHLDIMHDGMMRIDAFLYAAQKADVDFIIQLGDFSYPKDTSTCLCAPEKMPINLKYAMECPTEIPKLEILNKYNLFSKPKYHLLGNHECDFCSKADALEMYGMEKPYYSFHLKGWHFIVLDGNSYRDEHGDLVDYNFGKYFETTDLPYLGEQQLVWLREEVLSATEPIVIFSHQPLYACPRGLRNVDDLQKIIREGRAAGKRIQFCMNGHVHRDIRHFENGILYYTLNSISNYWAGTAYATHRYSSEIEAKFPNLQFVVPYADPIYAIVTLDENGVSVKGVEGHFVPPSPEKTGITVPLTPSVASWSFAWDEFETLQGDV